MREEVDLGFMGPEVEKMKEGDSFRKSNTELRIQN